MLNYDFNKALSPDRFQDFARDILQVREKNIMESFRKTKDGGIDIRTKKDGKVIIGQAKRYSNKNDLMKDLRNVEIKKVKELNPDRYILITSIDYDAKTKSEIMELFKGYIHEESDIIGNSDLNNYLSLKGYEDIEENYPELWINSTRVLEFLLEKSVHRKIYNASIEEFKNIKENEKTYVEDIIYEKAKQVSDNHNCLLITGEAGIGKTSLARHICYKYFQEGYKFVYAYDVDDIWENYTDKAQVFFIDDFWGSIFKEEYDRTEEKKFKDVIEAISKSENKKLILTSREYIIEKGFKEHQKVGTAFNENKYVLKLENYSNKYKAQIYLKHIKESNLNLEDMCVLVDNCEKIIKHSMYNPRLIAEFIKRASKQVKLEENYNCYEQLKKYLDNPEDFIKDIFDEQTEQAKLILVLLFLQNWEIKVDDLKKQYYEYLTVDSSIGKREDFSVAMKQLSNDLIRVKEDENYVSYLQIYNVNVEIPILVDFLNPSIKDFIYKYFLENSDKYSESIINSTSCLNTLMYLSGTYSIQQSDLKQYNVGIKELQESILRKIMMDYDKLHYRYRTDVVDGELTAKESKLTKLEKVIQVYKKNQNEQMKNFIEGKVEEDLIPILNRKVKMNYEDRGEFVGIIGELVESDITIKIEPMEIIDIYYNSIEYAREFEIMEFMFEEIFPKEIKKFMKKKEKEIKSKLPKMLMENAIYCADRGYINELSNIVESCYPSFLKKYNFKKSKRYENNLKYVARQLYNNGGIYYEDEDENSWQKIEIKQMIEKERNIIINKFEKD